MRSRVAKGRVQFNFLGAAANAFRLSLVASHCGCYAVAGVPRAKRSAATFLRAVSVRDSLLRFGNREVVNCEL